MSDDTTATVPSALGALPAMKVRLRPEVAALPRYIPGQSIPGAVKLSSNENPVAPGSSVLEAGGQALAHANRYPDLLATQLREALACTHGVDVSQICVGAGSSAILLGALMAVAVPGAEVVYPWRSFESYPIAVPAAGARSVPVPLTPEWNHDLPAMLAAITPSTAAVILCTPNNPTGGALTFEQIRSFVAQVAADVLVIIDEAYFELADAPGVSSAIDLVGEFSNLLVMRTFSKVYALAGLRVGYGIAHPDLVGAVNAVAVPFAVSAVAQAAALAALEDREGLATSVAATRSERARVLAGLRSLGCRVPDSQSNFVWIPAEQSGPGFVDSCSAAGLIVRPFPEGVRISMGLPEENNRFLEVARAWMAGSE